MRRTTTILLAARRIGHPSAGAEAPGPDRSGCRFTQTEIARLRLLVRRAGSDDETVRAIATREMEEMGFHQADFCPTYHPGLPFLSELEFDDLVGLGVIRVIEEDATRDARRRPAAVNRPPFRPALSH